MICILIILANMKLILLETERLIIIITHKCCRMFLFKYISIYVYKLHKKAGNHKMEKVCGPRMISYECSLAP